MYSTSVSNVILNQVLKCIQNLPNNLTRALTNVISHWFFFLDISLSLSKNFRNSFLGSMSILFFFSHISHMHVFFGSAPNNPFTNCFNTTHRYCALILLISDENGGGESISMCATIANSGTKRTRFTSILLFKCLIDLSLPLPSDEK